MSRFLLVLLLAAQLPTELPSTKFSSGQDIQPYFEGWIHNADGTFDLVFGYFNRNWQEELAIPAGRHEFTVRITDMPRGAAMNLKEVRLVPAR